MATGATQAHVTDMLQMNPQVRSVLVGVRTLRKIPIYPLSMGDQFEMTDLVAQAVSGFVDNPNQADSMFIAVILELIKNNAARILTLLTGEDGEALLKEVTNTQALEIATITYEVNYKELEGNVKSLFGKMSTVLPSQSERPLVMSASDMDTGSQTSSEPPSETGA